MSTEKTKELKDNLKENLEMPTPSQKDSEAELLDDDAVNSCAGGAYFDPKPRPDILI